MKTQPINMTKYPYVVVAGGDEAVKLRRLEWLLLNYMLENRGDMLTPYVIYRDVWKLHPSVIRMKSDGAIATCITRIQQKVPEVIIGRVRLSGWVLV